MAVAFSSNGQLSSSMLPIIVINTSGIEIEDEPKVFASIGIIDNGPGVINNLSDPFTTYDGDIGIETRGNSSQGFEKKSYTVQLWSGANNLVNDIQSRQPVRYTPWEEVASFAMTNFLGSSFIRVGTAPPSNSGTSVACA